MFQKKTLVRLGQLCLYSSALMKKTSLCCPSTLTTTPKGVSKLSESFPQHQLLAASSLMLVKIHSCMGSEVVEDIGDGWRGSWKTS